MIYATHACDKTSTLSSISHWYKEFQKKIKKKNDAFYHNIIHVILP